MFHAVYSYKYISIHLLAWAYICACYAWRKALLCILFLAPSVVSSVFALHTVRWQQFSVFHFLLWKLSICRIANPSSVTSTRYHGQQSTLRSCLALAALLRCLASCLVSGRRLDLYSGVSLWLCARVSKCQVCPSECHSKNLSSHHTIINWSESHVMTLHRYKLLTNGLSSLWFEAIWVFVSDLQANQRFPGETHHLATRCWPGHLDLPDNVSCSIIINVICMLTLWKSVCGSNILEYCPCCHFGRSCLCDMRLMD